MTRIFASNERNLPNSTLHVFLIIFLSYLTSYSDSTADADIKIGLIIEGVANINNVDIEGIAKAVNLRLDMTGQNSTSQQGT